MDLSELLRKRCMVVHVDFRQEVLLLLLVGIMHGEVRCLIRAQHGMRSPDHLARLSRAERKHATEVSLFRINVRVSVQRKCSA